MRATSSLCLIIAALGLVSCGGNTRSEVSAGPTAAGNTRPTAEELDPRILAFADRYAVVLGAAIEELCNNGATSLRQRREAHRLRAEGVLGVWDIATGPDTHSKILDLVLVVTLQSRVWIDEGTAITLYGERAQPLIRALRQLRLDVWDLAAQALTQPQLQELDQLILAWRIEHAQIRAVSFVRFDEAGAARGKALATAMRDGGGLFAPLDRAIDEAARTRLMGERLFWMIKRSPMLLQWQSDLAFDDLLLRPEVADLHHLAVGLPDLIARERTAIIHDAEQLMNASKGLVTDGRATAEAIAAAAASAERMLAILAPSFAANPTQAPGSGKAFDINEYATALREAATLAQRGNETLGTAGRLLGSGELPSRLHEFNLAATERVDHASSRAHGLMIAGFLYAFGLITALFCGLIAYRRWGRP